MSVFVLQKVLSQLFGEPKDATLTNGGADRDQFGLYQESITDTVHILFQLAGVLIGPTLDDLSVLLGHDISHPACGF